MILTEIMKKREGVVHEKSWGGKAKRERKQGYQKKSRPISLLSSPLFHSWYWITAVNSSTQRNLERCIWFVTQHATERGGQHLIYEPGTLWSGSTTASHLSATSQHLKFNSLSDCYVDLRTDPVHYWTQQTLFVLLGKNYWEMIHVSAVETSNISLL